MVRVFKGRLFVLDLTNLTYSRVLYVQPDSRKLHSTRTFVGAKTRQD